MDGGRERRCGQDQNQYQNQHQHQYQLHTHHQRVSGPRLPWRHEPPPPPPRPRRPRSPPPQPWDARHFQTRASPSRDSFERRHAQRRGSPPTQRQTLRPENSRQGAHGSTYPPQHAHAHDSHSYQSPPRQHQNSFPPRGGHAQKWHPHPQRWHSPPRHRGHSPPRHHGHSPPRHSGHFPPPPPPPPRRHSPEHRNVHHPLALNPHQSGHWQEHQHSRPQQHRRPLSPSWRGGAPRDAEPKRPRYNGRGGGGEARDVEVDDRRPDHVRFGRDETSPVRRAQSPVYVAPGTPVREAPATPVLAAPGTPLMIIDSPAENAGTPLLDSPRTPLRTSEPLEAPASPQYNAPLSPVCDSRDIATLASPCLGSRSSVLDRAWPAGTPVSTPTLASPVYIPPAVDARASTGLGTHSPVYVRPPVSPARAASSALARSRGHERDGGGRRDDSGLGGCSSGERIGQGAQSPAAVGFGGSERRVSESAGRSDIGRGYARVREGGGQYDDRRQGDDARYGFQRDAGRGAGGSGQAYGARHGSGLNGGPRRVDRRAQPYGEREREPYGRGQDRSQDRSWGHHDVPDVRLNFSDSRYGGYGREAHPRNRAEGREPSALDEESAALRQRELFGGRVRDSGYHNAWTSATTSRLHRIDVERSGNLFCVDPSRPTRPFSSKRRRANAAPSTPASPDRPPPVQNDDGALPAVPTSEDDSDNEVTIVPIAGEGGDGTGYIPKNTYGEAELTGEAASKFPPHLATSGSRIELIRLQVRNNADGEEMRTDLMHPASSAFINGTFEIGYIRQLQRAVKHEVANAKKRKGGRRRRAAKAARNQEVRR